MITGYFLIDRDKTDFTKIILEPFYYGSWLFVIYIVLKFAGVSDMDLSTKSVISFWICAIFNPASGGIWWFVTACFFLMLISPLLNHFLRLLTKKGMLILIMFLGIMVFFSLFHIKQLYNNTKRDFLLYDWSFLQPLSKQKRYKLIQVIHICGCFLADGKLVNYIISYLAVADGAFIVESIVLRFANQISFSIVTPLCSVGIFSLFAYFDGKLGKIK